MHRHNYYIVCADLREPLRDDLAGEEDDELELGKSVVARGVSSARKNAS